MTWTVVLECLEGSPFDRPPELGEYRGLQLMARKLILAMLRSNAFPLEKLYVLISTNTSAREQVPARLVQSTRESSVPLDAEAVSNERSAKLVWDLVATLDQPGAVDVTDERVEKLEVIDVDFDPAQAQPGAKEVNFVSTARSLRALRPFLNRIGIAHSEDRLVLHGTSWVSGRIGKLLLQLARESLADSPSICAKLDGECPPLAVTCARLGRPIEDRRGTFNLTRDDNEMELSRYASRILATSLRIAQQLNLFYDLGDEQVSVLSIPPAPLFLNRPSETPDGDPPPEFPRRFLVVTNLRGDAPWTAMFLGSARAARRLYKNESDRYEAHSNGSGPYRGSYIDLELVGEPTAGALSDLSQWKVVTRLSELKRRCREMKWKLDPGGYDLVRRSGLSDIQPEPARLVLGQIEFIDRVPQRELPPLYRKHCAVVEAVSDAHTTVAAEVLAAGGALITVSPPDCPKSVKDSVAVVRDPYDPEAWEEVFFEPPRRPSKADGLEDFCSLERFAKELEGQYRETIRFWRRRVSELPRVGLG